MFKERIFRKDIPIDNFRTISKEDLLNAGKTAKGKTERKEAELIAQVYYTHLVAILVK